MAYPYTTNPYQQQYFSTNMYQQQPPTQPQQSASSTGSLMTIFVNSEDEVNNYPVAAGLTVLLISFNLKKFWLKTTDTSGVPQQVRSFEFEEKTPTQIQNGQGNAVGRDEFDALAKKLDALIGELGGNK